jgi:hypothetical protein
MGAGFTAHGVRPMIISFFNPEPWPCAVRPSMLDTGCSILDNAIRHVQIFLPFIEYRISRDIEYPLSSTEFGIVYFVDSLTSEIGMQAPGNPA